MDLVAHSLGGLVVRECLARNPALAARVKGVVTLATPHQGTLAANFCLPVPEAKALRRSGPDVARPPALRDCAGDARVLTLIGDDDLLVYPQESSQQTGAAHQVLAGHGHFSLLYGADAIDRTLEFLAAG